MAKPHLILIGGPTASGKTDLAIALAQHLNTVILSADSRQFYRELRIGNARPDAEELAAAPHYFIADRSVEAPLSAGAYAREALALLEDIYRRHDTAIVVGGSGLYLKALTEGLDEFPEVPAAVRAQLEALYQQKGLAALQRELAAADPTYYAEVDRANPARLLRALAVCRASGQPYSYFRTALPADRPFQPHYLTIDWPRDLLYERIDLRVERMLQQGLVEEARSLYPLRHLSPLQTVGYQELFAHFEGHYDLPTAIGLIQRNSRRYAKRQLTWLRRDGYWQALPPGDTAAALRYVDRQLAG